VIDFIQATQPEQWKKLEALHGDKTGPRIIEDLCNRLDTRGSLATLRHGFKCYGRTLRVAFFKAAHELNPELEAKHQANRVGVTRQLHYSTRNENSLDVVLSVNGIPVATLELKNPLTGQTVQDAIRQYQTDRDPREVMFEFKRRTLVHFAADPDLVYMTTRLAGSATHFPPFNRGCENGAGNPPDEQGRHRTAYLWDEVLCRDSLLDLLARFLHLQVEERRTDDGRKVRKEAMIFPRYHQLRAVRRLVESARSEGVGHNYLIEHSAGSGKSNTIGWLAHRLASLHNDRNERVFDSVIVITDRLVLDSQLQDTIYQFDHRQGVVQKIDANSRQLAEALENSVPIVISTLQKFPFVSRQLRKMAEERGESGTGVLPTRKCAVIVDEAHSSQSGETATDLKEVLGGALLRETAAKYAAEDGVSDFDELYRSMAKRGRKGPARAIRHRRVPGVAGRGEIPERVRSTVAAHDVRGSPPVRHSGGANAVAAEPHASAEGRHVHFGFRERPARDSGGLQAVLRGRGDGRGSRTVADVRDSRGTRLLGNLHERRGRAILSRVFQTQRTPVRRRPSRTECDSRSGR
jgi:type I restriction enzyme R subunit